jgi:hypothetical protein
MSGASVIFQSAKLGNIPQILEEIAWAEGLLHRGEDIGRVYGISGGALVALAFALQRSSQVEPGRFGQANAALADLAGFLRTARSRDIRRLNLNPMYGLFHLRPLRRWLSSRVEMYTGQREVRLGDLPVPVYLCAGDRDATLTLFGPEAKALQFAYSWVRVGPPIDAPVVDALIAALSTLLSTEPARVHGDWYRDCRPAIVDARAIVANLEAGDPCPIVCGPAHAPLPAWKLNWITSSFIMHRAHERNQMLLARYYTDLLKRDRRLQARTQEDQGDRGGRRAEETTNAPGVFHIDLPYVGSTEASTNMRQSVAHKGELLDRFRRLLDGQLDGFPFNRPANVIYGAGGFSGILAGLATTRLVEAGFESGGGQILQIYGVSAGVLNGFFHAVQVACARHPDVYTAAAGQSLGDLETFIAHVEPKKIARVHLNPFRFWKGWASLGPLEAFLLDRLAAYTGSRHPEQITFDDIGLPLTVAAARNDGLTDFLGMTSPPRHMHFGGVELQVLRAPIVRAMIAGWSMNTYIAPTVLGDQAYRDGGGSFYDPGLLVACLDDRLTDLVNIHLDEPEGHSYHLPPRPTLVRLLLDTHNYNFPEERRRMRRITDLLYAHYRARQAAAEAGLPVPPDFRQAWALPTD